MGFSATLQGSGAHEALLARQDAELKLLETMRRCLSSKVKCDREFASALGGVAAQSQKRDWAEELADSLVAKVNIKRLNDLTGTLRLTKNVASIKFSS